MQIFLSDRGKKCINIGNIHVHFSGKKIKICKVSCEAGAGPVCNLLLHTEYCRAVYFLAFILYCENGRHGTLSVSSAGGDGDSERDEWKSKEAASDWRDYVKRNHIGQKSLDRLAKSSKR